MSRTIKTPGNMKPNLKRSRRRASQQSRNVRDAVSPHKMQPIRNKGKAPARNKPCPCGSGQKFKKCCGRPQPKTVRQNPYKTMAVQYTPEQIEAEQAFIVQWGFNPNPTQLMMFMGGDHDELKASILRGIAGLDNNPKFYHTVAKLGRLITPKNQRLVTKEELEEWATTLAEFDDEHREQLQDTQPQSGRLA